MYKLASGETYELSEKEIRKMLRKYLLPYQMNNLSEITSGFHHWKWFTGGGRRDFIYRHLQGFVKHGYTTLEIMDILLEHHAVGPKIDAIIIDGRWVARCECGGQEVVDPDDPIFVCLNPLDLNTKTKHKPRQVKFPKEEQQTKIAEVLLARPNPINRNWLGETIAELEAENIEHGIVKRVKVVKVNNGMVNSNQ